MYIGGNSRGGGATYPQFYPDGRAEDWAVNPYVRKSLAKKWPIMQIQISIGIPIIV